MPNELAFAATLPLSIQVVGAITARVTCILAFVPIPGSRNAEKWEFGEY